MGLTTIAIEHRTIHALNASTIFVFMMASTILGARSARNNIARNVHHPQSVQNVVDIIAMIVK